MATRGKGEALVQLQVRGAARVRGELRGNARRVQDEINREFRQTIAPAATEVMQRAAPRGRKPKAHKPGPRLRETIDTRVLFRSTKVRATVYSNAVDPFTGYHYTGVTRFGHRKKWIRPKKKRGPRARLVFYYPRASRVVVRKQTRGVKVSKDWTVAGFAELDVLAAEAGDRIGRRVIRKGRA